MNGLRAAIGILLACTLAPPAIAATPCNTLAAKIDAEAGGPVFLPGFPTVTVAGPLKDTAFLYDNAVASLALIGCGYPVRAGRIGNAILIALDHDRYWHDGRLRNAYLAGPITGTPVKLPGWWDSKQKRWVEDQYQAGSDTGNMAWTMLALLALDRATHNSRMRDGAKRIAIYLEGSINTVAPRGYTGGMFGDEPSPKRNNWKSTEHNTDLAAALHELAAVTGDSHWRMRSEEAAGFVAAMWDGRCACFAAGTGPDGHTRNPKLALDAELWPLFAIPGAAKRYARAIETAKTRLGVGSGFAYSDIKQGQWTEGTAQAALLMELLHRKNEASVLLRAVARNRTADGSYFATNPGVLPTGFGLETDPAQPRLYFHLPHLAALAWAALAETHFNPFTATKALPR